MEPAEVVHSTSGQSSQGLAPQETYTPVSSCQVKFWWLQVLDMAALKAKWLQVQLSAKIWYQLAKHPASDARPLCHTQDRPGILHM